MQFVFCSARMSVTTATEPAEARPATRKTVNISEEARTILERRADEEKRSMTGHLEWLIEQDLKQSANA